MANLGVRPSLDPSDVNGGRVLLETHCLQWPAHLGAEGAYGKIVRVELLHKLHDELKYDSLGALTTGIAKDCDDARAYFASSHAETRRQTPATEFDGAAFAPPALGGPRQPRPCPAPVFAFRATPGTPLT